MSWNNEVSTALTNDDQKIAALEKRITQLENAIAAVSYTHLTLPTTPYV